MKTKLLLLSLVPALAMFPACNTTEPQRPPIAIAYRSLKDTWTAVDSAMQVYGTAYRAGKVSADTEKKIDSAHERFRLAFLSTLRLARHDWSSSTPEDLTKLSTDLLALVAQLN